MKGITKVTDEALDAGRGLDPLRTYSCSRCFGAGTLVETETGDKPIEEIFAGEKDLARSDVTGDVEYKSVIAVLSRTVEKEYVLTIGGNKIIVTEEHPFYIESIGWVRVEDLQIGDRLVTKWEMSLPVEEIELKEEETKVYNFSVDDYHTYFVSDLQILTHNNNCSPESNLAGMPYPSITDPRTG